MDTLNYLTYSTFAHADDTKIAIDRYQATETGNRPMVMFCGGFHSAMQGTKARACMTLCQQRDWHCTLFDYRGHGQSGGKPHQYTLSDWLDDTLAVLDEQPHSTILVGSSMGAWLATLAALQRPDKVRGLMLLAAAPDFLQELVKPKLTPSDIWDLQQGQIVNLASEYDSSYPLSQALLDNADTLSLLKGEALKSLHCPVRLIHGTQDTSVPYTFSTRLLERLPIQHDARLTLLHGADHRLSDASSLSYISHELSRLVQHIYTA